MKELDYVAENKGNFIETPCWKWSFRLSLNILFVVL